MYNSTSKTTWRSTIVYSTACTAALLLVFGAWNGQADAAVAPAAISTQGPIPIAAVPDGTPGTNLSGTVSPSQVTAPANAPAWFLPALQASLSAWLPAYISWTPGVPVYLPQLEIDPDPRGATGSYQPAGPTYTPANAFFTPFGNGRACVTCHTPNSAMGLSLSSIRARYVSSYGRDPLFAPVDGATCPKNVPRSWVAPPILYGVQPLAAAEVTGATALSTSDAAVALGSGTALSSAAAPTTLDATTLGAPSATASSSALSATGDDSVAPVAATNSLARPLPSYGAAAYATILNKGLIRIALPVPQPAEFTVQVVSDPYGCNTDPLYNQVVIAGKRLQQVSVYRRPLMSANLKFKLESIFNDPNVKLPPGFPPLPLDPSGKIENGNIMWDGREATLSTQATDALKNHAQLHFQLPNPPLIDWINQMINFELGIYTAQITDNAAGNLTDQGATGGPVFLSNDPTQTPSPLKPPPTETMSLYDAWNPARTAEVAQRASIYRGQIIFNGGKKFFINNAAGATNLLPPQDPTKSPAGSCTSCHTQLNVGASGFPNAQIDIGIAGDIGTTGQVLPATDLPVFRLTCTGGKSTLYNGATVLTNDPGKALITGKCADIGTFTTPTLRGLAARAPYFSDGSAPDLASVVAFYNIRFNIGLTAQDQTDLVNFLNTL